MGDNKKYSVYKTVKKLDEQNSHINGTFWILGRMTKTDAEGLAENLALIDWYTLRQVAMCELEVFYQVVDEDTREVVKQFNMFEDD